MVQLTTKTAAQESNMKMTDLFTGSSLSNVILVDKNYICLWDLIIGIEKCSIMPGGISPFIFTLQDYFPKAYILVSASTTGQMKDK